jgi:Flp pilus assembly secretin CpaC
MRPGLRFFGFRAAALALAAGLASSATAAPNGVPPVTVMIDHAKVVKLPEKTQTVIVGNPIIADVTVQRNGILVVTGKSYGVTNLIALDAGGALLTESSACRRRTSLS